MNINQGWQCPVCERVYAPHVDMCKVCGKTDEITCPVQPCSPFKGTDPQNPFGIEKKQKPKYVIPERGIAPGDR